MAGNSAEMKVKATMDNSDLKKKAKESKDALKDFAKIGEDAVSSLGSAFGVNVDQIKKMSSAIEGLGIRLESTGNKVAASFGKMLTSVSGFAAAVVALPLAGAIAGFKALNSEAEAFKNTVAGANIELASSAYVATYKQFLRDSRREIGESAAKEISTFGKEMSKIWANISGLAMSGYFGAGAGNYNTDALLQFRATASEAEARASKAEQYMNRIFRIQRLISDSAVEWAKLEREIAEYKRIAYDKTADTVERQEALAKANELIVSRYEDEAVLRNRLANMQAKMNDLSSSSIADIDKANQLRIEADRVVENMNNKLRETGELQATLADKAQKEAEARQAALEAMQKMAAERKALKEWGAISEGNTLKDSLPGRLAAPDAGIAIPVTPVLDTESVVDITNELQSVLTSAFDSIGTSLGGLIGDLATGGDAWNNFTNSAISAFGDMAVSIGKMAISTGVATLGIKAALESLNPYVAIAAGTALVALGMAVKSGLSNIASGNYSSSNSVATSGYGSSSVSNAFETREVEVSVKGTLYASGNQLLAVIENENNRKNHTT
jgi:hypothetical protein